MLFHCYVIFAWLNTIFLCWYCWYTFFKSQFLFPQILVLRIWNPVRFVPMCCIFVGFTWGTEETALVPLRAFLRLGEPEGEWDGWWDEVEPTSGGWKVIPNNHLQNLWTPVEKMGYSPYQLVSWYLGSLSRYLQGFSTIQGGWPLGVLNHQQLAGSNSNMFFGIFTPLPWGKCSNLKGLV